MFPFPPDTLQAVSVYRSPTGSTPPLLYPSSATYTVTGAFMPIDRKNSALEGLVLVEPHELYVEATIDIQASDKIVVGGKTFYVKKVFDASSLLLGYKRCSCSREAPSLNS